MRAIHWVKDVLHTTRGLFTTLSIPEPRETEQSFGATMELMITRVGGALQML